jgi:hypothetical protein
VCDAIRSDRFWILTHDDEDAWMDAVRHRALSVTEGINPGFNGA